MMVSTLRIAIRGYLFSPLSIATDGYIGFSTDGQSVLDRIFVVLAESRLNRIFNDKRILWAGTETADTTDGSC